MSDQTITESNKLDETQIIKTITTSPDFDEVLTSIVIEQGLDPMDIDITKLSDAFMKYLQTMKDFSFRMPARFILVASILLTIKCEKILEDEEKRLSSLNTDEIKLLDMNVPTLVAPIERESVRKVTLGELISALNKSLEIKKGKEILERIETREAPDILIKKAENIEKRVEKIYTKIRSKGMIKFSDLVPIWHRKEIMQTFLPLLFLANDGKVVCEQPEMFKEIYIKLK
ncbi:MAG: segregation/condensation protein A [Candidatus Aenigmatarchaeota archaeon]